MPESKLKKLKRKYPILSIAKHRTDLQKIKISMSDKDYKDYLIATGLKNGKLLINNVFTYYGKGLQLKFKDDAIHRHTTTIIKNSHIKVLENKTDYL